MLPLIGGTRPLALTISIACLEFGLGDAQRIDALVVHWTDGSTSRFADLGVDKRYSITQEGRSFLALNQATVDGLLARLGQTGGRFAGVPAPILRGMENLKLALRLRLKDGPVEDSAVETIAAALDAAARAVEQSR